jgi:hypothetical protein
MSVTAGYHFIEVIWGPQYIDLFLSVSLATQLSEGNLPAFAGGASRYRIFTKQSEIPRFRAHPMFARLASIMPVDFVPIDTLFTEEIQVWSDWFIRVMSEGHRRAIRDAQAAHAALFFLSPDILCGRGSLRDAAALLRGKPGAVMVIAPRLNQDALSAALEVTRRADGVIDLEPRQLVALGLQYMHRATSSLFWDDPHFEPNPTILYWRVGPRACIAQGFHLHPLLVAPANWEAEFTDSIDGEYVERACPDPRSIHVPRDTDTVAIFSTTGEDRTIGGLLPNKARVSRIAQFYEAGANPRHRYLFSQPIRIHAGSWPLRGWYLLWRARALAWMLSTVLCGHIARWPVTRNELQKKRYRYQKRWLHIVKAPWAFVRRVWTRGITIPSVRIEDVPVPRLRIRHVTLPVPRFERSTVHGPRVGRLSLPSVRLGRKSVLIPRLGRISVPSVHLDRNAVPIPHVHVSLSAAGEPAPDPSRRGARFSFPVPVFSFEEHEFRTFTLPRLRIVGARELPRITTRTLRAGRKRLGRRYKTFQKERSRRVRMRQKARHRALKVARRAPGRWWWSVNKARGRAVSRLRRSAVLARKRLSFQARRRGKWVRTRARIALKRLQTARKRLRF